MTSYMNYFLQEDIKQRIDGMRSNANIFAMLFAKYDQADKDLNAHWGDKPHMTEDEDFDHWDGVLDGLMAARNDAWEDVQRAYHHIVMCPWELDISKPLPANSQQINAAHERWDADSEAIREAGRQAAAWLAANPV